MKTSNSSVSICQSIFGARFFKKLIFIAFFVLTLYSIFSCSCGGNPVDPNVDTNGGDPVVSNVEPDDDLSNVSSNIIITSNKYIVLLPENMTNAFIDLDIMIFYTIASNYDTNNVFAFYEGGVDAALVNTNNLNVDLDNFTISGNITLPQALDFESPSDENKDNDYEIANIVVSNIDNVSNSFKIIIRIVDTDESIITVASNQHIVFLPENMTNTSIDLNIMAFYSIDENYDINNVFVSYEGGVDAALVNTNNLNVDLDNFTISGNITLPQALDFESPSDENRDNDYEVAIIVISNIDNVSNSFKIIVRIVDVVGVKSLEILIDSYYLDDINNQREIRELYLYSDSEVPDPITGTDVNNFLSAELIASTSVIGNGHAAPGISGLYDGDDTEAGSGFLTPTTINSNSNDYHRLTLNFTEELLIKKLAISGRESAGYYGFVFIFKDDSGNIIYTHQATNDSARGTGSPRTNFTSTYSFTITDITNFTPITDFSIGVNQLNLSLEIAENVNTKLVVNNATVASGYEYESLFVTFDGVDATNFTTNNLRFINNQLKNFSFKAPPDYEDPTDADRNNVYELGTATVTNVDGGSNSFTLQVIVNDKLLSLHSAQGINNVTLYTSNIIGDLRELVFSSEGLTYSYQLSGAEASYFKIENNTLKTSNDFAFRSVYENDGQYNVDVNFLASGVTVATFSLTVQVNGSWSIVNNSAMWSARIGFQSVVLGNGDVLVMGGHDGSYLNDIWRSSDGGSSWSQILASAPWPARNRFQSVVLGNGDVLVMGGDDGSIFLNDIWRSSDGGNNWSQISVSNHWRARRDFQSVVLGNENILVMSGDSSDRLDTNDIWRSSDGGSNWSQVPVSNHWSTRNDFQSVVLGNGDVLVMGGNDRSYLNDIWRSSDGGNNWSQIPASGHWRGRSELQSVVLTNGDVLVLGGFYTGNSFLNDIWRSSDGGNNWSQIPTSGHWGIRRRFQSVVLKNGNALLMGGANRINRLNDVWVYEVYNRNF